jgi:hypothetical protein
MLRSVLALCAVALAYLTTAFAQVAVHVTPPDVNGTHTLQEQTAAGAIRDYVEAWQSFKTALEQNRIDVLDRDFVGTEKEKLGETIRQQVANGIHAVYQDNVHDIQIVFYSPDGMSLELTDNAEYEVQVIDHNKSVGTQRIRSRYIVVLTPAETRWRVRVLQAVNE